MTYKGLLRHHEGLLDVKKVNKKSNKELNIKEKEV